MTRYEIEPFHLRSSSDADYARLNDFKNVLRREFLPDDPPISCSESVRSWQAMASYIEDAAWAAWDESHERIAAFGEARVYHTGDNEHELNFSIDVHPDDRRRGLARQMLRRIVEQARSHNRRLLVTETNGNVPGSSEFLSAIGAQRGLESYFNQLRLSELDTHIIERWLEQSRHLSGEFRLGWWDGRYPEDRVEELAALWQVLTNDQPRDSLDMEDVIYTPAILRESENATLAGGQQRWVLYVTDRRRDRIAGLTVVFWHPDRPAILTQGFTGVLSEYRGQGLGRWLKAEMLRRVLRERPQAQVIRTGNADSNAPMLKINNELGFKPYVPWCVWQVEAAAAEKYLAARG